MKSCLSHFDPLCVIVDSCLCARSSQKVCDILQLQILLLLSIYVQFVSHLCIPFCRNQLLYRTDVVYECK